MEYVLARSFNDIWRLVFVFLCFSIIRCINEDLLTHGARGLLIKVHLVFCKLERRANVFEFLLLVALPLEGRMDQVSCCLRLKLVLCPMLSTLLDVAEADYKEDHKTCQQSPKSISDRREIYFHI